MDMVFIKNEEQQKWLDRLKPILARFAERAFELDESRGFPFENVQDLKDIGYTRLTLPKKYGGSGMGLYDFLLFQEKIAEACGPTALSIGWHVGIVLQLLEDRGWKKEVLDETFFEIGKGALINRAASEPVTGSPTRGGKPATSAKKKNDKWVISGRKTFTTMAPVLDLFLVSAWLTDENRLGWFLIHRNTPGVRIEKTWDMISMQGTGSEDLVLEHVIVDEKYLVEQPTGIEKKGEGWLLHIPACYLGIASAARNYAVAFANSYSPNSIKGPIGELPNVQRLLGEIELELLQARHFLFSVAEKWENLVEHREELMPQLAAVKNAVTNTSISVVDKAMRIVGAKSLQRTNPLQRYYRAVRAGLHNPPMDDATFTLLARYALVSSNEN
ncbi:acyl-CoA dehydrogenase family protein [Peribacillus tepidiphilus]|uniref:acyl-CoA dehydrogenase family protein n=1 Tax=Peribacillus tepidiphilus TaxID=2652445 RepID=UPI0012913807|nr:acyl-CoA dehydrogenase family protein [Peribacillus tepidiphilus]